MGHFWWKVYRGLPVYNMGMKNKILVSFFILAMLPLLTLGTIGFFVTEGAIRLVFVVITLSSVVGIYFFAGIFSKNLTWLMFRLLEEMKRVEAGDLRGSMNVEVSNDEIGQLTISFKRMIKNLQNVVVSVMEAGNTVSSSSQELAAAGEEMNASTEEVSSSIQKIAETAQNQSVQINDAVNDLKVVADKSKIISLSAEKASESGDNVSALAHRGGELSKEAIDKIQLSNEAINLSAQRLKQLQKESEKVGAIVKVITDVADQTNLLALNAAIEAARAGEHGRGFAVVAEEVRKLAEESAQSADEISHLIGDMKEENQSAVEAIEKSFDEFKTTTEMVRQALDLMIEMKDSIESFNTLIKEISSSSSDQSASIEKVLRVTEDITAGIEDSAASVEEVNAAAEEQASNTQELSNSAQNLAELATDLTELINQFKINSDEFGEEPSLKRMSGKRSFADAL